MLLNDYEALAIVLAEATGDQAALRSLKRKYEELEEAVVFGDTGYKDAKEELLQEFYDCLPVDA